MPELAKRDENNVSAIMAVDGDAQELYNLRMDDEKGTLRIGVFYWDADQLTWVRGTQADASNQTVEDLLKGDFYHDNIISYDGDNNVDYVGMHATMNASTSNENWLIFKIGYDSNNNTNRVRVRSGAWASRTTGWS